MGPLTGLRIIELAAIGPVSWTAMMLSDMGAEVIRVDRGATETVHEHAGRPIDFVNRRGRRSIAVDLKHADGAEVVLRLVESADALIEGFRPGVAERLGIGPEPCRTRNPRLVYGRMTGWGQEGPMRQVPGHDLNYLGLTGLLHAIGPAEHPTPPLNLVADFGGGGLLLAFGIVCGVLEAAQSGEGQVIDAAMIDGAALIGSMMHGVQQIGYWSDRREANRLDGGAPFYGAYETADGRWLAVAANEPRFYSALLDGLGLATEELPEQHDEAGWPRLRSRFASVIRTRTREEWLAIFAPLDTCVSPVLTLAEAPHHPHSRARGAFVTVDGVQQAAPAPRFSRTPGEIAGPAARPAEHTEAALRDWGFDDEEISELLQRGAIARAVSVADGIAAS